MVMAGIGNKRPIVDRTVVGVQEVDDLVVALSSWRPEIRAYPPGGG